MIIACDLDRTLLPNGSAPDDGQLPLFFELLDQAGHTLVYVTGRNIELVHKATETYGLRYPDFLIGDVGTTMYKKNETGSLELFAPWKNYLKETIPQWDWGDIVREVPQSPTLYLQEAWRQNPFKCSYYALGANEKEMQNQVETAQSVLKELHIDAQVIYSEDPIKHVGLIDILPTIATKLTALQYLTKHLDQSWKEGVIYCGDSGNDILPLTSGCKAVVVKNADAGTKDSIQKLAVEKGITKQIYIANGATDGNGNYASGVIEGLRHHSALS